ncbi:hypothetical protein OPV22_012521 [Ensete ventricosum]|uniref:Uncharacterized protein n=1 Tax=Ensete ventricosum TaxID=4639 RepID=A0AAV8QXB5_ENSVE|nr:hypothetical protein OPV22_012521 [Ensete ventricosum]
MRLNLPIRSLRCHCNPRNLVLDGEWEITRSQLDLLPAGHMKPNWSRDLLQKNQEDHIISMSYFTHPVTLLGSCSSTVTPLALDSLESSD